MHNCGIQTSNLVHTFRSHYHYAASVDTSVLQMSVTRFIFNRPCSPRAHSRHLTAGVGHTVRDQPQRPRRPWLGHRRPGPPLGSPSPGVPVTVTGTLAPTGRQFLKRLVAVPPDWSPVEPVAAGQLAGRSALNTYLSTKGSLPAGHWAAAGNWIFHKIVAISTCGTGHVSSESDCRARKHEL